MKRAIGLAVAVLLAACGSKNALTPPEDGALPARPYGAQATPTPDELTTARPEARPERSDELLKDSVEREPDPFDLPPGG